MTLPDLRRALVIAKDALRTAKDDHETTKALREQYAIDNGALNGCTNDKLRDRALAIALEADRRYIASRDQLRAAEHEVNRTEAEIAILEDDRKARELACRERANEVLDRLAAGYERMAPANPVRAAIDTALPF